MARYNTLKAAIADAIKTNGQQQITGQSLQTQLLNMVTALGKYFQSYGGLVTPTDSFTAGDESVIFFATEAGTYTDFGGAVLDGKTLHILYYDGSWHDADTLIPSGAAFEAALALAIKGAQSGIAEGIADTISAGTAQEFLQRQSGGDGVNCIKRIKGKTIAWNQLVDEDSTEVTIPSGHKYFAIIGGTASVATSDGTAIAVTGGVDVVTDLTLLGLGDLTADQFRALYPALYYAPASVLKSNDAAALLTDGRNQWDEEYLPGTYSTTDGETYTAQSGYICSKNKIPVFAGQTYYVKAPATFRFFLYDKSGVFFLTETRAGGSTIDIPSNAGFIRFQLAYTGTYQNDICINLSDASFNGTYEPYWQRVLALRLSELTGIPEGGTEADRVTMFPNGAGGVGTSYDSIAEGKSNKRRARVDLGSLVWTPGSVAGLFIATITGQKMVLTNTKPNDICGKYIVGTTIASSTNAEDKTIYQGNDNYYIFFKDTAFSGYTGAQVAEALSGVMFEYELATPIVYTDLQYADGTPFTVPATILVDNGGTERIQAPEGATTPSAPFCCDSNYSIGVANLVKRLAALENAE